LIGAVYWLGIAAAVLINIAALTLLAQRLIPFPAMARAAGIVILCLALFSLEHFVGLGTLRAAGLPLTAVSLYVLWHERARFHNVAVREDQIAFLCAFLYGAVWRLSSIDITEGSDRLTDFHLVANYLSGSRLPPLDYWLPHQNLDYYYSFQHYSAALLGRLFGLGPGASFNFAAVLLAALVLALAWEFLSLLRVRFSLRLLSVAALAIGGTGVSPLFHVITTPTQAFAGGPATDAFWNNSRFIGWFKEPVASDTWRALFGDKMQPTMQLPIETFGFQYPLGGYHAVLAGFLLQFMALTVFVAHSLASTRIKERLDFVAGLTVPLTICASAWMFPLQAALVGAWKVWSRRASGQWELGYLLAGAGAGVLLLLPFLAGLGTETGHMQLELVHPSQRAPLVQFLIVFWPLIVLAFAVPLAGRVTPLAGFLGAAFLALLACSELVNVSDGGYTGDMLRFNSALKWWGWIFTGGVFSISACLLASNRFAIRLLAAVVLLLASAFVFDTGRLLASRSFSGNINGTGFYAQQVENERIIQYLAHAPRGIVLEKLYDERPVDTGIYGSFALQPNLVGIPWVLRVWKRDLTELPKLIHEIEMFYAGDHPQAARFLLDSNVRYVVWSAREGKDVETWQKIADAIDSDYRWMEFSRRRGPHIGLWIRR
jgi:Uncharacterized membrane protein (DUF2298)